MCLLLLALFTGPRVAILFWWLVSPARWESAFDSFIVPALGFVFLPWTTMVFVAVAPTGRVDGADWIALAVGFFLDLASSGLGLGRRTLLYR